MTPEQKKLVEDNHWRIYYFCKRFHVPCNDWYDVFAMALCNAAVCFKGDVNCFGVYAHVSLKNAFFQEKKKRNKHKYVNLDDAPEPAHNVDFNTHLILQDILGKAENVLTKVEKESIKKYLSGWKSRENKNLWRAIDKLHKIANGETVNIARNIDKEKKEAVKMYAKGYRNEDIAKALDIGIGTVALTCKGIKRERTSAAIARLHNVDRSTVVKKIRKGDKIGNVWEIQSCGKINKPYPKYSKAYTQDEIDLLRSGLNVKEIAQKIGRSENSIRIKMHRLSRQQ